MNPWRHGLPLALCAMESAWMAQVGGWITSHTGAPAPGAVLFGLVCAAAFSTRSFLASELPIGQVRRRAVLWFFLSLLLAVRVWYYPTVGLFDAGWLGDLVTEALPGFINEPRLGIGLALFAVAWYRGVVIGRSALAPEHVFGYFLTGCVALVVGNVLHSLFPVGAGSGALPVLVFFASGLAALALSRLDVIRESRAAGGEPPGRMVRQWFGFLVLLPGVILFGAVIVTGIVGIGSLGDLTRAMGTVVSALLLALVVVMMPVVFAVEYLVYGLRWLLSRVGLLSPPPPPQIPERLEPPRPEELPEATGLPPEAVLALQAAGALIILGAAAAVLMAALFRRYSGESRVQDEERESLWSWRDGWKVFLASVRALLDRVLGRLQRRQEAGREELWADARDQAPVRTVREIYRAMLRWSALRGLARRPAQTPHEFLANLRPEIPTLQEEAATITRAYVTARYDRKALEEREVQETTAAWRRINDSAEQGR